MRDWCEFDLFFNFGKLGTDVLDEEFIELLFHMHFGSVYIEVIDLFVRRLGVLMLLMKREMNWLPLTRQVGIKFTFSYLWAEKI